jgi:hypothetical protein
MWLKPSATLCSFHLRQLKLTGSDRFESNLFLINISKTILIITCRSLQRTDYKSETRIPGFSPNKEMWLKPLFPFCFLTPSAKADGK